MQQKMKSPQTRDMDKTMVMMPAIVIMKKGERLMFFYTNTLAAI